jgi:abequosyltransferase
MALLTIAIPTYNRARFLDRCLGELHAQLEGVSEQLEIIVSDNCSVDDTPDVVERYRQMGMSIKYLRNSVNEGSDYNIAQCYRAATGKYVVAFSDDDVWRPGSLRKICSVLSQQDWGVVYLRAIPFNEIEEISSKPYIEPSVIVYSEPDKFLRKVNVFVTFISGNIINRKFIEEIQFDKYLKTGLIQLPLILNAIYGGWRNVYIEHAIGIQLDNSGGYNLFSVFGSNFYKMLIDFKARHRRFPVNILVNELLTNFFPHWVIRFRRGDMGKYEKGNPFLELKSVFKGYFYFWLVIFPLFHLPLNYIVSWEFLLKVLNKFRGLNI